MLMHQISHQHPGIFDIAGIDTEAKMVDLFAHNAPPLAVTASF